MDYSENIKASHESDLLYAKWYAAQSDERKASMIQSGYRLAVDHIRQQALNDNPFSTKADVMLKFIEATQQSDYPEAIFDFIRSKMAERSEKEWIQRFRDMKKTFGWTYDDIARFIGAESGNSIKASVSRRLPAFAKLSVCIFEQMQREIKIENTSTAKAESK